MKAKEIRDLIDFISSSDLDEVNIETQEFKLAVKKNSPVVNTIVEPAPVAPVVSQQVASEAPKQVVTTAEPQANETAEKSNHVEVKSPMIGTFYTSASPDSDAFVNVGDTVKVGQTVCIIEAMKLFNEIESEYSGKIVKILVENATPVEYDQPLFIIDPS